jgi:hypothetical protein
LTFYPQSKVYVQALSKTPVFFTMAQNGDFYKKNGINRPIKNEPFAKTAFLAKFAVTKM